MVRCHFCDKEPFVHGGGRDSDDPKTVECPRCGKFCASPKTWESLANANLDGAVIGGWIREQNSHGITPMLAEQNIDYLRRIQKPRFEERVERYLLTAIGKCEQLNSSFHSHDEDLIGTAFCGSLKEMFVIRNYLIHEGLLNLSGGDLCEVTPKGHIAADGWRTRRAKSSQAFVAMWFDTQMNLAYEKGLSVGIENAGYKSARVDKKEHANKIDDEIIGEIRRSAFLVADFTEHRGGVYFEAGFAMGLGLPVIWTCRKDHMKDLHFDIRQYNCIDWSDADELATRLQQRIEAMFGRGPMGDLRQAE